jgi:glycosyltransferase involved in cell wall biosynthesis
VRVAIDEQIFAIQHYGGISRLFAELARTFTENSQIGVDLEPLGVPIVNRYLLDNPELTAVLETRKARSSYSALARYFLTRRPTPEVDLVHNTFYLPHGLTGYTGARRVVTIHDMIPEMMPETRRRLDFITLKRRYISAADHIICVSNATKADLIGTYGEPNAPISVVHHGVDPMFRPGSALWADLPHRYVLFVGNRNQYKDAPTLIRAFAGVKKDFPDHTLLFVGGGSFTARERRLVDSLGLSGWVQQRALPDAAMSAAYSNADIYVFPSRFEGFGLPALEAMACGTATILAAATSLPEVGGDAAEYFTPGDHHELGEKMKNLLTDPARRKHLVDAGLARAALFSWDRCAKETAAVYEASLQ